MCLELGGAEAAHWVSWVDCIPSTRTWQKRWRHSCPTTQTKFRGQRECAAGVAVCGANVGGSLVGLRPGQNEAAWVAESLRHEPCTNTEWHGRLAQVDGSRTSIVEITEGFFRWHSPRLGCCCAAFPFSSSFLLLHLPTWPSRLPWPRAEAGVVGARGVVSTNVVIRKSTSKVATLLMPGVWRSSLMV